MKKKMVKVLKVVLIVLAVIIVIGSFLLGKAVADMVMHQNKDNDTKSNSLKQLEAWGYDLEAFNAAYTGTEINVTAEDGNAVPGTAFTADDGSDKWVILVHGAGGDRVCTYPLAQGYLERGYNVIAIDQRGCGDSADENVTFGINEKLDVEAVVMYARNELGASEVIVHGQSMGAQTTALYASNVTPGEAGCADAVICDSPVPGMEYMLRSVFSDSDNEEDFHGLLPNYLIFTSGIASRLFYGIDYADGDTIEAVKTDMLPTMVILSENDKVCLPDKVEEVYNNIGSDEKELVRVGSAHIEGVIDDPDGYMDSVMNFLGRYGL